MFLTVPLFSCNSCRPVSIRCATLMNSLKLLSMANGRNNDTWKNEEMCQCLSLHTSRHKTWLLQFFSLVLTNFPRPPTELKMLEKAENDIGLIHTLYSVKYKCLSIFICKVPKNRVEIFSYQRRKLYLWCARIIISIIPSRITKQ